MSENAQAENGNRQPDRNLLPQSDQQPEKEKPSTSESKQHDQNLRPEDGVGHQAPFVTPADRSGFWTMVATVILAFATLALAIATADMARSTRQLAGLAEQQAADTKNALSIQKDQAAAAAQLAATQDKQLTVFKGQLAAFIEQQKPDVRAYPGAMPYFIDQDKQVGWNINFFNAGHRAAQNFTIDRFMSLAGGSFAVDVAGEGPSVLSAGVAKAVTVHSKKGVEAQYFQELLKKDFGIRLFSIIKFRDDQAQKDAQIVNCWGRLANGAIVESNPEQCAKQVEAH